MEGMLSSLPLGGWDGMLEHAGSRTHPSSDPQTWCFTVFTEKKRLHLSRLLRFQSHPGFPRCCLWMKLLLQLG